MSPQDLMMLQYKIIGAKHVTVGPISGKVSNIDMQVYWHLHTQYFGFMTQGKHCFISQETIAEALNLSTRTIMRAMDVLEDLGLIARLTKRVSAKKTMNSYGILHYTLALFDGKKIEGETPDIAFDDPLATTYDSEEVLDEESVLMLVYGNRGKIISWKDIEEKDVPY